MLVPINYMSNMPYSKPPTEKINLFWISATLFDTKPLEEEPLNVYKKIISELIETMETSFIQGTQLHEFAKQKCKRPDEEIQFCCISWDYLIVLCDAYSVFNDNLEPFKKLYNEACNGIAGEFIFVPHLWDFIRQTLDKETKHHSPYYDTLKKLDKLLLETPVFSDYEPEIKNHSSHNKWF